MKELWILVTDDDNAMDPAPAFVGDADETLAQALEWWAQNGKTKEQAMWCLENGDWFLKSVCGTVEEHEEISPGIHRVVFSIVQAKYHQP